MLREIFSFCKCTLLSWSIARAPKCYDSIYNKWAIKIQWFKQLSTFLCQINFWNFLYLDSETPHIFVSCPPWLLSYQEVWPMQSIDQIFCWDAKAIVRRRLVCPGRSRHFIKWAKSSFWLLCCKQQKTHREVLWDSPFQNKFFQLLLPDNNCLQIIQFWMFHTQKRLFFFLLMTHNGLIKNQCMIFYSINDNKSKHIDSIA